MGQGDQVRRRQSRIDKNKSPIQLGASGAAYRARRDGDGALSLYLMNGFQVVAAQVLGGIGADWSACYGQPPLAVETSQR
jgi:hypothetical protein